MRYRGSIVSFVSGAAAVLPCVPLARAQWSVVNLHPPGATRSLATGVQGGQQSGVAVIGGLEVAVGWKGTAAMFVSLNPAGASNSIANDVHYGRQAGYAIIGGSVRASIWSGSAASRIDLHPAVATGGSQVSGMCEFQQVGLMSTQDAAEPVHVPAC